jgi:hypothetical protein
MSFSGTLAGYCLCVFILNDLLERDRGCVMTKGNAAEGIVAKLRKVRGQVEETRSANCEDKLIRSIG